jgi:SAM-dependent methyltransferase
VSDEREDWERKWAVPGFTPVFRADAIPDEIQRAVEDGWFPPGGSVVDIGCGSGEIAAWLAQRGYQVVGVDFAPSAIGKAKDAHGDVDGVTFEVVDICRQAPPGAPFDALLDRGCLQRIPAQERPAYLRHVAAAAKQAAPFLILHRVRPRLARDAIEEELRTVWAEAFDLVEVADTVMAWNPRRRRPMPGLAIRLIRRS